MIEILKEIEKSIGIEVVINFMMMIIGIGIGAGITDALWKGDESGKRDSMDRRRNELSEK